jgi:hypothetical protein
MPTFGHHPGEKGGGRAVRLNKGARRREKRETVKATSETLYPEGVWTGQEGEKVGHFHVAPQ